MSATGFDRRLLAPLVLGAVLNPVNSSIVAVSLVPIGRAFEAPASQTAWLVTGLYVATAIGQPVFGRLIDTHGARPLFLLGCSLTGVAGVLGGLAPSVWALLAARVLLGLGTCAGYPAAMSLVRREADRTGTRSPGGVLTVLAVSSQTISVIGPTLGGLLIGVGGWRATLLVNVPLAVAGLWLGARRLPRTPRAERPSAPRPGAASRAPLRALLANGPLLRTYLRTLLAQTVAYSYLYGYTQWLQDARGLHPAQAGLVLLPLSVTALATSALTGRRPEVRAKLLVATAAQVAGAALLLVLAPGTAVLALVGLAVVMGLPQGLANLANQTALFHQADPAHMGASAGLLRTSGYSGAIVSSVAIGGLFGDRPDTAGLHHLALLLLGVSLCGLALAAFDRGLSRVDAAAAAGARG